MGKVASDLFEHKKSTYLLVVEYFSRFVEIEKLISTTSSNVITYLKAIFSLHDNPASYSHYREWTSIFLKRDEAVFINLWISIHYSSPHYHQSDGQAERAVRTVKSLLTNSSDSYLALLNYRATPLPWCGLSPAELLMGRAVGQMFLNTQVFFRLYLKEFREMEKKYRDSQKRNHDKRYRTRSLPELPQITPVCVNMQNDQVQGTIWSSAAEPRSYIVTVPSGEVCRNRYLQ